MSSRFALLTGLLLGCHGPQRPVEPSVAKEREPLAARVERIVNARAEPAAVVVLDASRHVLALAGARGLDPKSSALRPGSSVKPLLAAVAARAGVLDPSATTQCNRASAVVDGLYCYDRHGPLALTQAIEVSCNEYFYALAHRVGLANVRAGFTEFGFGTATGLVAGEDVGVLPGVEQLTALRSEGSEPWSGWAPLMGGGHGPIQLTLLQLASGYWKLAQRLDRPSAELSEGERAAFPKLREGLKRVVSGEHGTGRAARVDGMDIAGKTGTAEDGAFVYPMPEAAQENGWFVGFTPSERPRWVVAVSLRGKTGREAAALAGDVFRALQSY